ncbi:hypothetical protein LMIY3S_02530 [Labrys miyagiensis]
MAQFLYEDSLFHFVLVTVIMGGWAAWMTGKACAASWSRYPTLFIYLALLTAGVRFLHQAPFGGNMFSPYYFVVDLVIVQLIGFLSYRLRLVNQMVSKYGWMFEKAGSLNWNARSAAK